MRKNSFTRSEILRAATFNRGLDVLGMSISEVSLQLGLTYTRIHSYRGNKVPPAKKVLMALVRLLSNQIAAQIRCVSELEILIEDDPLSSSRKGGAL